MSAGPGLGSTFTVRLPCFAQAAPAAPVASPLADSASAVGPLRILVVDDNLDAAQTLSLFLRASGHTVEVVYCALDAIDVVAVFKPQVCLLDIGLPDIDGNELARRLRALPDMEHATLIAATGYGRQQDREQARQAGFDHYLVKPLNTLQLGDILVQAGAC